MSKVDKSKKAPAISKQVKQESPSAWQVLVREFKKDKVALFSLAIFTLFIIVVFVWASQLDAKAVMRVDIFKSFLPPNSPGFPLGTDRAGKSILGQLILGARNSILVGLAITALTTVIGIMVGLTAGYYGGKVDQWIMRVIDFISILPTLMIIIVFVSLMPNYKIYHFVLIMSAFYWVSVARLVRSKVLSEARRDYVNASKTMGTSDIKIMLRGILPNIISIIIVQGVLNFAGNIGIETGLSFLGFGFPPDKGSLGTLISYARDSNVLQNKIYVWLPASLLIFFMMLSINYVGQALRRASDAKQRLG
ncbi:MAG: ABC transporter permease [Peptostreptococcaceae bacterium]|nr:ABC transporter permease [Peptostreptococcaceae bacterium]